MQHRTVCLSDKSSDVIAFSLFCEDSTNHSERARMKKILFRALSNELTPRQRDCITMYYFKQMKMYEIAYALDLSPSTVTRHIKAAKRRLSRVAECYIS